MQRVKHFHSVKYYAKFFSKTRITVCSNKLKVSMNCEFWWRFHEMHGHNIAYFKLTMLWLVWKKIRPAFQSIVLHIYIFRYVDGKMRWTWINWKKSSTSTKLSTSPFITIDRKKTYALNWNENRVCWNAAENDFGTIPVEYRT